MASLHTFTPDTCCNVTADQWMCWSSDSDMKLIWQRTSTRCISSVQNIVIYSCVTNASQNQHNAVSATTDGSVKAWLMHALVEQVHSSGCNTRHRQHWWNPPWNEYTSRFRPPYLTSFSSLCPGPSHQGTLTPSSSSSQFSVKWTSF